ncbi:helix-turn-helix domain-containing protein [Lactobacillus sp. 3B(2020)]|uniref:helix-turn-helix domain-containing protein n=1 Tax=Lactobacillus sp. 3B(2020) TaxID=2695882 RepID=UPI0015DF57FA|nr:helix-turn-helix transcriptional regulator [Lactobacillus sp. 3B(2020)]QLL70258.1 helix-turn-helix domain-containing protein [Lactobacillus sp. 3B(2020)]
MNIGSKIKDLRKASRMSQTDLGKLVHVSQQTITAWENNKAEPASSAIIKLAEVFNVTTDYLLGRPEKGNSNYTDEDLEEALDRAHSFSGKPLSDHDRKVAKDVLRSLFQD